ncbi:MAG: hypothetical protein FWH55_02155 [Oscillospiraceae bacterium]|nr:hypothetical protein [Oscillospiraceae bacterium]
MKSKFKQSSKSRRLFSAILTVAVVFSLFAALPLTAGASTAFELEEQINDFAHGGEGNITATASGATVTVTGKVEGATKALDLRIDSGVTVIWKAEYSGPGAFSLVYLSGEGVFEVAAGGSLKASGTTTSAIGTAGSPKTNVGGERRHSERRRRQYHPLFQCERQF